MNANIISIADPRNATIINDPANGGTDWCSVVKALLSFWIESGRCFSSGEVAACLREHNPSLRFSVPRLGETVRDMFYNQLLPQYASDGVPDDGTGTSTPSGPVYPCQVARVTEGLFADRTPANVQVFVYGPNSADCYEHPFEVFIPRPKADGTMETQADAPAVTVTPPASPTVQAKKVVKILGVQAAKTALVATVRKDDLRLVVPRAAFELAVGLGGQPMRGGDPVFVKVTTNEAVITLTDPGDGVTKSHSLTSSSGRVAFYSADPATPFAPGDSYPVKVTAGCLTIDLTTKV